MLKTEEAVCQTCTYEETLAPGECGHIVCGYCYAAAGVTCPVCKQERVERGY